MQLRLLRMFFGFTALGLSGGLSGCLSNPEPTKLSAPRLAQASINGARRISIAEVGTVRLEVEQPSNLRNEIQIRVRDHAANARQKKEVSCDLYYIDDHGNTEGKFMSVALKQSSSNADDYSGGASDREEFEHGNKFKVVYQSDGLPLPISTWYACYYH